MIRLICIYVFALTLVVHGGHASPAESTSASDAASQLADRLAATESREERLAIVQQNPSLMTRSHAIELAKAGDRLSSSGMLTESLRLYDVALSIAEKLDEKALVAEIRLAEGGVHMAQGNYDKAESSFRISLEQSQAIQDTKGVCAALADIGDVYYARGDYIRALETFHRGLSLAESMDHNALISSFIINIGIVHNFQGDHEQAIHFLSKGINLAIRSMRFRLLPEAVTAMAFAHIQSGHPEEALRLYQQALAMSIAAGEKKGTALARMGIGYVQYRQKKYSLAAETLRQSLREFEEAGNKQWTAVAYLAIGEMHGVQKQYDEALSYLNKATQLAQEIGEPHTQLAIAWSKGDVYRSQGRFDDAIALYTRAIDQLEKLRSNVLVPTEQAQFMETVFMITAGTKDDLYRSLVIAHLQAGEPDRALQALERAKARALLTALQVGRIDIDKALTPREVDDERTLRSRIIALNTQVSEETSRAKPDTRRLEDLRAQLDRARAEFEAFRNQLYSAHPELKIRRGEAPLVKESDAVKLLANDKTAICEFLVMIDRTYLFVLTRAQNGSLNLRVFPIEISRMELTEEITRFRQSITSENERAVPLGRKLYDLIFKPANELLSNKSLIVLIPDDVLWELPFQALQGADLRFMIESHALSYAPSLTALREMQPARAVAASASSSRQPKLLALGNPDLSFTRGPRTVSSDRAAPQPLPYAEKEVTALASIYGPRASTIYIREHAREDRFKSEAAKNNVLHIAAHGLVNDVSPMYSQISLTPGKGSEKSPSGKSLPPPREEDGLLEAWELMNLNLKADLVVLSACESGRGRILPGEGVIGLSWAFFVAGCRSTVVSQWKVRDASTAELMVEFHRNLRGGRSKAESLRMAQLLLIRGRSDSTPSRFRHPYFWAPFILVGNWK